MSKVVELKSENFEEVVLKSNKPVLVDFWASWCSPCKMLLPTLDKLSEEVGDDVLIVKVNVDDNVGLAKDYGVRSIPTLLLIEDGEVKGKLMGNQTLDNLKKFLN
jgi:thioredoxin 1